MENNKSGLLRPVVSAERESTPPVRSYSMSQPEYYLAAQNHMHIKVNTLFGQTGIGKQGNKAKGNSVDEIMPFTVDLLSMLNSYFLVYLCKPSFKYNCNMPSFLRSLQVHLVLLKRIDFSKQYCLAHPLSFECFHCSERNSILY